MLRDLRGGKDAQVEAALSLIVAARADVILLMDVDWDFDGLGLGALQTRLQAMGAPYPHALALRPNSGAASGLDLDGDGRLGQPRDALGYGWFTGDSGLALLSRYPLGPVADFTGVVWADRADLPPPVLPAAAHPIVPLPTTAQWVVPVIVGDRQIDLVTLSAGTPVFDGPEDRNGRRNADELDLVVELVEAATLPLVLGRANQDPTQGEGDAAALRRLLDHPALQAVRPTDGGDATTVAFDTARKMRLDYILPSRSLAVLDSGLLADDVASRSRLLWVDVALP